MPNQKIIDELVEKTFSLQQQINKAVNIENNRRKKENIIYDELTTFNLTKEEIRKNIEAKYDIFEQCTFYLNNNKQVENENKHYAAQRGDITNKENYREPYFLNVDNAFKAYGTNEFKDVIKQVNTKSKACNFKMNCIEEHINSDHLEALGAALSPSRSLEYLKNNEKKVYLGANFKQVCSDTPEKINFSLSKELNQEIANKQVFYEDSYKSILSQVNFNASPLSFLVNQNLTDEQAKSIEFGVNSMSYVGTKDTEELLNLKNAASCCKDITGEKMSEYNSLGYDLLYNEEKKNSLFSNAKKISLNERNKYFVDSCKDRIDDQKRSIPLSMEEYVIYQQKASHDNLNAEKVMENCARYLGEANTLSKEGDIEYENKIKYNDHEEFIKKAIKEQYTLENMSGSRKFFSKFGKANEDSNYCGYLQNKVASNEQYIKDNNLGDFYKEKYNVFKSEKENQKKLASEEEKKLQREKELEKQSNSIENYRANLLSTPASKGKSVFETRDNSFNPQEALNTKNEMEKEYKKCGFFSRQFSRLIPDALLKNSVFRWVLNNLIPFNIGTNLLDAADCRREIQLFNRKMDRGFHSNPLGKGYKEANMTFEQKAVADYKNNYKSLLKEYYQKSKGTRILSAFIPKSWTDTGKLKLDIENNDILLQDIIGNVSSGELEKMKSEMMDEFLKEQNDLSNQKEKKDDELAFDKVFEKEKEKDKVKDLQDVNENDLTKNIQVEEKNNNPNINENENVNENQDVLKEQFLDENVNTNENKDINTKNIVNENNSNIFINNEEQINNQNNFQENKDINKENHRKPLILNEVKNELNSSPMFLNENDKEFVRQRSKEKDSIENINEFDSNRNSFSK